MVIWGTHNLHILPRSAPKSTGTALSCSSTSPSTSPCKACGTSTPPICSTIRSRRRIRPASPSKAVAATTRQDVAATSRQGGSSSGSSSWQNQQASRKRYGQVRPRKHLATRAGQHVWPRTKPPEDDVEAIGSSRATSGHDLSRNGYGVLLLLLLLLTGSLILKE